MNLKVLFQNLKSKILFAVLVRLKRGVVKYDGILPKGKDVF
jgi:hypothetical protein